MQHEQELAERERVLNLLDEYRPNLVSVATAIANEICRDKGRVTSSEVFSEMNRRGIPIDVDKRFMGVVFRAKRGWERIGWEPTGSHCRPVAIWRRLN